VNPMRLETYARTETGRIRPTNQDAVGCFPEMGLFAVADGMGGHDAGEVASKMAIEHLRKSFGRSAGRAEEDRLVDAIASTNNRIFVAGHPEERPTARPMGTTLVTLFLSASPKRATWAYVGDSRLYLLRKDKLTLLTADHTRYGGKFSGGREIPLELPHTNELLAALGIDPWVEPGRGSDGWKTGDVFLLCSDGVSGLLAPDEIHAHLSSDSPIDEIGECLIEDSLEAGGSDNASVVVVRVRG